LVWVFTPLTWHLIPYSLCPMPYAFYLNP